MYKSAQKLRHLWCVADVHLVFRLFINNSVFFLVHRQLL